MAAVLRVLINGASYIVTGISIKDAIVGDKIIVTNFSGIKVTVYVEATGRLERNKGYTLENGQTESWGRNASNGALHMLFLRHDTRQYLWVEAFPPFNIIVNHEFLSSRGWNRDIIFPTGMFEL